MHAWRSVDAGCRRVFDPFVADTMAAAAAPGMRLYAAKVNWGGSSMGPVSNNSCTQATAQQRALSCCYVLSSHRIALMSMPLHLIYGLAMPCCTNFSVHNRNSNRHQILPCVKPNDQYSASSSEVSAPEILPPCCSRLAAVLDALAPTCCCCWLLPLTCCYCNWRNRSL